MPDTERKPSNEDLLRTASELVSDVVEDLKNRRYDRAHEMIQILDRSRELIADYLLPVDKP